MLGNLCRRALEAARERLASRLARDSLVVLAFSGAGRALALGKELLVAYLFGVGGQLDAYVLALLIPSFLVNMLGASFSSAYIPALGRIAARGGDAQAGRVAASGLSALALLSALGVAFLACLPPAAFRVISPLAEPERLEHIRLLALGLAPLLAFGCVNPSLAALVNLRGDFRGPAVASLGNSLAAAAVVAAFGTSGVWALVAAMDAGCVLESCALLWLLRRRWPGLPWGWRGHGAEVAFMLRGFGAMAASAGLLGVTGFVDNALASTLGEGAVSALSYAAKLPSVFSTLGGMTLATVLLPHFAGAVHRLSGPELWRDVKRVLGAIALVAVPVAVAAALASEPLVRLLFQRGGFEARATGLVAGVQAFYMLQLPLALFGVALARVLQARARHHLLLGLVATAVTLNAGLSFALIRPFGVAGLGMSSLCMYAFTAAASLYIVRRSCLGASGA